MRRAVAVPVSNLIDFLFGSARQWHNLCWPLNKMNSSLTNFPINYQCKAHPTKSFLSKVLMSQKASCFASECCWCLSVFFNVRQITKTPEVKRFSSFLNTRKIEIAHDMEYCSISSYFLILSCKN